MEEIHEISSVDEVDVDEIDARSKGGRETKASQHAPNMVSHTHA